MSFRRIAGLIVIVGLIIGLAGSFALWQRFRAIQPTLPGPNLLPNSDFTLDADGDDLPDGWTTAGVGGVRLGDFTVQPDSGHSVEISGINNYIASPFIAVRPGATYRVVFQALADDPDKQSATRVRVRFHWRDGEGVETRNEAGAWQAVPYRSWAVINASAVAPADATGLSISIHPASDDRIVIDELGLGQLGVRLAPWPDGKGAALALSFDYETAMGGLVHSRSDDPNASTNDLERAQRMRAGVDQILRLFEPAQIRGTWYTNGFNFLTGNHERRTFMGDPTYDWASAANNWPTDYWVEHPWFSRDPYSDEQADPQWYFGSQIGTLQDAGQDIQSHTFAHFAGGLVKPDDWRADFQAWNQVAAAMKVRPATSLAFPWSWSAGMRWDNWEVLKANGIRSVTRTNWTQTRFQVADRATYGLRTLPGHSTITVMADEYLTPESLPYVRQRLDAALLNEGAIDIWAHTEEVTSAEQRAAWAEIIAASGPFWVASVPDIVTWQQALAHVEIRVRSEQPQYTFLVTNGTSDMLRGLSLVLPFTPARMTVDGQDSGPTGARLVLDLPARSSVEVRLWPA